MKTDHMTRKVAGRRRRIVEAMREAADENGVWPGKLEDIPALIGEKLSYGTIFSDMAWLQDEKLVERRTHDWRVL